MATHDTDFGHATSELTATPWLAHLAGIAAASTVVLAWVLAVFVAPEYLAAYRDEAVALPVSSQIALRISGAVQGVAGWIALLAALGLVAYAWNRARTRGGIAIALLVAIAAAAAIAAAVVVLACGEAGHVAQDAGGAPR